MMAGLYQVFIGRSTSASGRILSRTREVVWMSQPTQRALDRLVKNGNEAEIWDMPLKLEARLRQAACKQPRYVDRRNQARPESV